MKLTALHPKWDRDVLVFDCPCGADHRLRVPCVRFESRKGFWRVSGNSFLNYSLTPSIDAACWHGHVVNGEVRAG